MTKRTHLVAGTAITLGIIKPTNILGLVICLVTSSIGGVISDIDVSTSKSRGELYKIIILSIISVLICIVLEKYFCIGILEILKKQSNIQRIIIGFFTMLFICCFGITTSHRTFMHSIIGIISLSITVFIIFPEAALPFALSMLSHVFLDLFNTKRIQIFYPLRKPRIALKFCKSNGLVSKILFHIATIILELEIFLFIWLKIIGKGV